MSSSGASFGVSVESVSLLSSDRNETITHSTESGGDAMSGVSVGTGVGDDSEGVEVAVTTRRKRGIPEFSTEVLLTKHCCSRSVVTCFRKLSQVDIDRVREHLYGHPPFNIHS